MSRGYLFGEIHIALSNLSESVGIVDDYTFQALDGTQDRQYLIESAGYLIEQAKFYLIEIFMHFVCFFRDLLAIPYEELSFDLIGGIEVELRYVLVALLDHLGFERSGLATSFLQA